MAETAGENFVFIILFVIFIFVIVLVFAYFLLFGFGFTNATSCYGSSQVTNFFYNDLCISKFFCISTTIQALVGAPPLIGCSPATQTYTSSSTTGQLFSGVADALGTCWYQYGANSGLDVLYNSPALCSVIGVSFGNQKNLTFYNLTQYLKSVALSQQISCLNHTAEQSCANYQSAANPDGFSCDTTTPTQCTAPSYDYFSCEYQQGYNPTGAGYALQNIFLNSTTAVTTAANNLSAYLCDPTQGCYFNKATLSCTNSTGQVGSCTQTFNDFCAQTPYGYTNCTVQYDSNTGDYRPPNLCTLTEPVNNNSVVNVSYFDYLAPGVNLLYSYKNKTSGQSENVGVYSNISINNAELYVVYLNSFANSALPPATVSMPPECFQQTWLNNYPTTGIEYQCSEALAVYGAAIGTPALTGNPSIVTLAGAGAVGYLYGRCQSNTLCNQYVDTSATKAITTALYTTSGLQGCVTSLEDYFSQLAGTAPNLLGRNQMYVCAVTS